MTALAIGRIFGTDPPRVVVACGLLAALASGCALEQEQPAPKPSSAPITFGEKDTGKKLTIERGQKVIVRLEGNITTGYTWSLARPSDETVLKNLGATFTPGASSVAGTGGTQSWSFEGFGAGVQELLFEYRRPWESGVPPAKAISYTITVR